MAWGLIAKHILRQPVRLVFTSAGKRRHSAYPRWLISQMDAVIATTQAAAEVLGTVDLIQGHGVDTQIFQPGVKTPHPSLAYVGRIRPEKGTGLFIEALCQVLPDFPEARVHILGQALAGDQPFLKALQEQTAQAGIADQVIWHGEVAPAEVARILGQSHILAATPVYEPFGLLRKILPGQV